MGRGETERLKEYIRDDRPRRLKSYIKKHKVNLSEVVLKKNRNLLHFCCKHGSGSMFRLLHDKGVSRDQHDDEENTPLHLVLLRANKYEAAGKSQQATDCYTDIILPYIQLCPCLLDARNSSGESCRELLRRLAERRERMMPKRLVSPDSSPDNNSGGVNEREWRDKLADEYQHEYQTTWGQFENAFPDSFADRETYNDWADRIQQEYYTKKRAQSAQARLSSHKRQKTSHKPPKTQAGPENLEETRAKMRAEFERKSKEEIEMKTLKDRMRYEKRYKEELDSKDKRILGYDDVPWPSKKGGDSDMTVLFEGMDKGDNEYRKYLRDQQVRWHPDKFLQRFGERLLETDKTRVLERVTKLSQDLNRLSK